MDIQMMRKYIYNNISNLSINKGNCIHDYIKDNNINHSENNNGIFINLSLCEEQHIKFIYNILNRDEDGSLDDNILKDINIISELQKSNKNK